MLRNVAKRTFQKLWFKAWKLWWPRWLDAYSAWGKKKVYIYTFYIYIKSLTKVGISKLSSLSYESNDHWLVHDISHGPSLYAYNMKINLWIIVSQGQQGKQRKILPLPTVVRTFCTCSRTEFITEVKWEEESKTLKRLLRYPNTIKHSKTMHCRNKYYISISKQGF